MGISEKVEIRPPVARAKAENCGPGPLPAGEFKVDGLMGILECFAIETEQQLGAVVLIGSAEINLFVWDSCAGSAVPGDLQKPI